MIKLNIRLKLLRLRRKLILGIMMMVFILSIFVTKLIYNYYINSVHIDKQNNKIDSSIVTYNNPIVTNTPIIAPTIIPTITPIPTSKPELVSRSLGLRRREIKDENEVNFKYIDSFIGTITKYTTHPLECGRNYNDPFFGITASGTRVKPNDTIATNPNIPFNSKVKIEGFNNIFTVRDRGSAIQDLKIDVYVESRKEAFEWGVQKRKVWILSYGKPK